MKNLALELRPQSLDEIMGAPEVINSIKTQLASGRIPKAWLFIGEPGTGKTSLAYILAKEVQGKGFKGEPEIVELNGADTNSAGTEAMKALISRLDYYPKIGDYRCIIVNEIQRTTDPAQQILLDPLEDKDSPNIFFFTTTDPSKINGALLSRCGAATYKLKGLDKEGRISLVNRAFKAIKPSWDATPILKLIEDYGVTSGRDIVNMVESYSNDVPLIDLIPMGEGDPVYFEIAQAALKKNWNTLSAMLKKMKPADAKPLRQVVSGVFRNVLLTSYQDCDKIATVLKELAIYTAYEAGVDLSALMAILYKYQFTK